MNIPNCYECGACCVSDDPKWIEVGYEDACNIPADLLQVGDIEQFAMRMNNKTCAAWLGRVGEKSFCTIYCDRPAICRKVNRGSAICMYMLGVHKIPIEF